MTLFLNKVTFGSTENQNLSISFWRQGVGRNRIQHVTLNMCFLPDLFWKVELHLQLCYSFSKSEKATSGDTKKRDFLSLRRLESSWGNRSFTTVVGKMKIPIIAICVKCGESSWWMTCFLAWSDFYFLYALMFSKFSATNIYWPPKTDSRELEVKLPQNFKIKNSKNNMLSFLLRSTKMVPEECVSRFLRKNLFLNQD